MALVVLSFSNAARREPAGAEGPLDHNQLLRHPPDDTNQSVLACMDKE